MGLREVRENAELVGRLYRYATEHRSLYPGIQDTHEIVDVLETDSNWRLSLGIGNQGESFMDITVFKSAFKYWEETAR
jgi:hypothetical protein